jgi:uncharacterized protein involved in outer membrane biogenesis
LTCALPARSVPLPMRKLAYAVAILVLLLGIALVVTVLALNRIIAANREAIVARVAGALGRPVQVEDISVRFAGGLGIGLSQIQIGDDPAFGTEPFLRAKELTARLQLWPLLHRRIEVGSVKLTSPMIRIVRAPDSRWNYESLLHRPNAGGAAASAKQRPALDTSAGGGAAAFALLIESATVSDGTLTFVDRSRTPASTTLVQHVDLRLRNVGFDQAIDFDLAAAVERGTPNVRLSGSVGPLVQRARLPLTVQGSVGPFKELNAEIDDLDLSAFVTPDRLDLDRLNGNALGGNIALSGAYALTSGGPVRLKGDLRGILLPKLLALRGELPSYSVEGSGSLRLDLQGTNGADLLRTLAGTVAVNVSNGALHDFNLVGELLNRVSGLPGLAQLVSARIKPKYGRLFTAPDTRFQEIKATLHVSGGRATTDDLAVTAEEFGVKASGWFDIDRNVDMTGTLLMSKRFSDDVVADVKEAKYVVDENGQLAIPFRLEGKLGSAKPKPDSAYLTRLLQRAVRRGLAGELLDKLLGGKKQPGATPAPARPASQLEQRLRDLLGR